MHVRGMLVVSKFRPAEILKQRDLADIFWIKRVSYGKLKLFCWHLPRSGSSAKEYYNFQCMTDTDTDNMADISMNHWNYKPDDSIYSDADHFFSDKRI